MTFIFALSLITSWHVLIGLLFHYRFRPAIVKELIHNVLHEKLTGIAYNQEESTELTKQLSDEIKAKLKGKDNHNKGALLSLLA